MCHISLLIPTWAFAFEGLAQRTGQENCWVKFSLRSEKNQNEALCIPHRLWNQSYSPSGLELGKWQAFSPLELEPGHIKKVYYRRKATGFENSTEESAAGGTILPAIEKKREECSEFLKKSGGDRFGVLRQLLLNESSQSGSLLRVLGFVHLISATGIHFCALSAWIALLLSAALRLTSIPVRFALFIKRTLMLSAWLWCWCLAGARVGMLRPLFLLAVQALSKGMGFRWKRGTPLLIALLADFLIGAGLSAFHHRSILEELTNPARTFYLFAVGANLLSREKKPRHLDLAIGAWILTSALELLTHSFVSLSTAALSWITIPLFAGVIYPILVIRSLFSFPIAPLLRFSDFVVQALAHASLCLHSVWIISGEAVLFSLVIVSLSWLVPSRWRFRGLLSISIASLAFLLFQSEVPAHENHEIGLADQVEQLDVGQGDGALVIERDPETHRLTAGLIDTGSAKALSEIQWLELLSSIGTDQISWVAITHLDEDHSGGILRLSSVATIGCATTSAAELRTPRGIRWRQALEARGVRVTEKLSECIPYPSLSPPEKRGSHENNDNMSAFFIPLRGGGFYLSAGDATEKDEPRIGDWAESLAKKLIPGPRILKISHHGSKTSTNPLFLKQIAPTQAWISDGIGNHYGHPSAIVLDRIQAVGIAIHRTDQEGTLEIKGVNDHHPR